MFVTIKKRTLWTVFVAFALLCIIVATSVAVATNVNSSKFTVVLDAGHGGADGGVVGVNSGVKESEINLSVTLILKEKLIAQGFNVVLTRSDSSCAGGSNVSKKEDMRKRKEIIANANPDIIVSVHCNKFPSSSLRRGAQTFYNAFGDSGKNLAGCMQNSLNELNSAFVGRTFDPLGGDYYILNCSRAPACIVECGFLSNAEDEKLLLSQEYKQKLADSIVGGILTYISEFNS